MTNPPKGVEQIARELDDARVYLGPFLVKHGLGGNILGHEAGRLYDAAVEAIAALTDGERIRREALEEASRAVSQIRSPYDPGTSLPQDAAYGAALVVAATTVRSLISTTPLSEEMLGE